MDGPDTNAEPSAPEPRARQPVPTSPGLVADSVISRPLRERMAEVGDAHAIGIVIEPRNAFLGGVDAATRRIRDLARNVAADASEVRTAGAFLSARLTPGQIQTMVSLDELGSDGNPGGDEAVSRAGRAPRGAIYRMWPDFEIGALIHRTLVTTKCDAVHRSFGGLGQGIVWAVLDSGIDRHAHFATHGNLDLPGELRHRSFVGPDGPVLGLDTAADEASEKDALTDVAGHGTHVAGIIAGEHRAEDGPATAATWYQDDRGDSQVNHLELATLSGMAPRCTLLSCKVLRDDRSGDVSSVLAALDYIQQLNNGGRDLQVHGVNLSVGYPFDPSWFAAGLTPVCREVDRLVQSGVVVVVAAGNTGHGFALDQAGNRMRLGFDLTINDPGNAEHAITVGSTSARPHTTGVSYFSSKGPTGDGRLKPDLVAPGERIVSAGAGVALERARSAVPDATYVEDSGTSMAAPHVSGAAAALLSVHREFIGRSEDLKRILMDSATDLGRTRTFQGRGMLDAMRAIQAV